jgi:hypothetical protein
MLNQASPACFRGLMPDMFLIHIEQVMLQIPSICVHSTRRDCILAKAVRLTDSAFRVG